MQHTCAHAHTHAHTHAYMHTYILKMFQQSQTFAIDIQILAHEIQRALSKKPSQKHTIGISLSLSQANQPLLQSIKSTPTITASLSAFLESDPALQGGTKPNCRLT